VNFVNGHAVFPTVTREVTAIATGTYPDRNGIFGHALRPRGRCEPRVRNDDHQNLLRLDAVTGGKMVLAKSLAEMLAERGKSFAAVSLARPAAHCSGNPRAPKGVGRPPATEPPSAWRFPMRQQSILRRFPGAAQGGARDSTSRRHWTEQPRATMCCRSSARRGPLTG
jgi:hypothetical protein